MRSGTFSLSPGQKLLGKYIEVTSVYSNLLSRSSRTNYFSFAKSFSRIYLNFFRLVISFSAVMYAEGTNEGLRKYWKSRSNLSKSFNVCRVSWIENLLRVCLLSFMTSIAIDSFKDLILRLWDSTALRYLVESLIRALYE